MNAKSLVLFFLFQSPTQVDAEVQYHDGTRILVKFEKPSLEVETKYGKLTVPISEIKRIDFGHRCTMTAEINSAVNSLGAASHAERERAEKFLIKNGALAWPQLTTFKADDLEIRKRLASVVKRVEDEVPEQRLRLPKHDSIKAAFPMTGKVLPDAIKGTSPHFGLVEIDLCQVRWVTFGVESKLAMEIKADDAWHDSGFDLEPGRKLTITAEGSVDLWPADGLRQYVTDPKGYSSPGKNSTFMAGALVGKFGEKGTPFLIGERYSCIVSSEDRLFLNVVQSTWSSPSSGFYRVRGVQTVR